MKTCGNIFLEATSKHEDRQAATDVGADHRKQCHAREMQHVFMYGVVLKLS